ncbi:MAG: DUF2071 domain-containing protein [Verrucomicrobiota bacterium]
MRSPAEPDPDQRLFWRNAPNHRKPVMFQTWRQLLFLHWTVDPEMLSAQLPDGLHLDLFEGNAYLGVVPFYMRNIGPRGLTTFPGLSNFLELNVRTYVYDDAGDPGVWFFSLDANNRIACATARTLFKLPYYDAKMHSTEGDWVDYEALRFGRQDPAIYRYQKTGAARVAEAGTLDFFLVERYLLFSHNPASQKIMRGQVHHQPYQLHEAEVEAMSVAPVSWNGMDAPTCEPAHVCLAEDVNVQIFGLEVAGESRSRGS